MSKYKYYFRKPKSEISKDFLNAILVAGAITIAASSPYFVNNLLRSYKRFKQYSKQRIADTFARLKREGLIKMERKGRQIYIKLTAEGKKKANYYQIDDLSIKKPKRWDNKWRVVIFDIAEMKKSHREAFRGKLKELGFYQIQRSVWVHPFECRDEVSLLRDFFGLDENDIRLVVAERIENDRNLKEVFKLG